MFYQRLIDNSDAQLEPNTNLGAIYTPRVLAAWVARQLLDYLPTGGSITILDPACGDGALLSSVANASDQNSVIRLIGADLDANALLLARKRLPSTTELHLTNSLAPDASRCPVKAWQQLLKRHRIDGIIANPPWGADIGYSRTDLKALGYSLANGQFDSFELFIEICLSIVEDGAVLAFIVPDAIFLPEHEPLRRLILRSSEILLIGRLGEGIFPDISRGTAVIILRKGNPRPNHSVECFRLTREWRQRVLSEHVTLYDAKRALTHVVRQRRFSQNAMAYFNIDISEREEEVVRVISESGLPWTRWFKSGRGIEISKYGKVIMCPQCGRVYPQPRRMPNHVCKSCGRAFISNDATQRQVVRPLRGSESTWRPLIVGEDVDRYSCFPSREILVGVPGISYKGDDTFKFRKLLVRKTGVGLKAAVDETGAYTNQVVFHYYIPPHFHTPPFLLDYVQAVLCSRVLFAYHLKHIGESEWRSHPYITQKVIASLPIPDICEGTWQWTQAQAIAEAVKERHRQAVGSHNSDIDVFIDCLVAGLFGIEESDCSWVLQVLDNAQALEPIRTLRLNNPKLLKPIRIA
jgi:predicted RNA methylase